MLKKKQRLTTKEFDHVFSNGKRYHSPTLQLIHSSSDTFHGAAVVGKKNCKKAVDRNRLRRRLYGVVYRYQKEHSLRGAFILIAKPKLKEIKKEDFNQEVESLLQQALR